MRRRALAVADDGRKYDSAVDLASPSLARGSSRGFKYAAKILGNEDLGGGVRRAPILDPADLNGNFRRQLRQIDLARKQDTGCIDILRQRQQKMFERHFGVGLRVGIARRTRQRRRKVLRHRYPPQVIDHHAQKSALRHRTGIRPPKSVP